MERWKKGEKDVDNCCKLRAGEAEQRQKKEKRGLKRREI